MPPTPALVRYRLPLLAALGLLAFVPFLGLRDLWYPDEPEIAEVCKAMYQSGDWISPRRMGVIWVDYPPMIYWAGTAASHALGGMSEFSLRFPNALAAIVTVLLTAAFASRWFGAATGLWAGFVLLTFQQFAYQAVSYRPDVLFTLFIAAGLLVYAAGAGAGGPPRLVLRIAGFALLGLAMLSKGPLGLLLPGLVLTLWHGSRREWRRVLELGGLALVALAVYLPWFAACARAMGSDNILYELYAQNVARFFAGARGHGQPWYYFLASVWVDLLPWSVLLPFAVAWIFRAPLRHDARVQLLLWWFGAFFVFLSLAVTKRQLYLLPAYPAAALLVAPWLGAVVAREQDVAERPANRPARVWALAVAALLASLGVIFLAAIVGFEPLLAHVHLTPLERAAAPALRAPLVATALVLLAVAAWIARAARRGDAGSALLRLGLAHVAIYVVALGLLMPAMNPIRTYRTQCEWILSGVAGETRMGLVNPWRGLGKRGAFGYYTGLHVDLLATREEIDRFLGAHPASLVLVHAKAAAEILGPESTWRERVERELPITGDVYLVLRAPGFPGI